MAVFEQGVSHREKYYGCMPPNYRLWTAACNFYPVIALLLFLLLEWVSPKLTVHPSFKDTV